MKKLFTLLLTLVAFAIGAQAVTTIHTIKAKSTDMITFPEIGNPVKTPTFTVTSGSERQLYRRHLSFYHLCTFTFRFRLYF